MISHSILYPILKPRVPNESSCSLVFKNEWMLILAQYWILTELRPWEGTKLKLGKCPKGGIGIIDGKTNAPGGRGFIPRNRLKFCMAARIMCNLPLTLLMPPKNILNHDLKHLSLILLAKRDAGKGGYINVIFYEYKTPQSNEIHFLMLALHPATININILQSHWWISVSFEIIIQWNRPSLHCTAATSVAAVADRR